MRERRRLPRRPHQPQGQSRIITPLLVMRTINNLYAWFAAVLLLSPAPSVAECDVFQGEVRLSTAPSLPDLAEAYENAWNWKWMIFGRFFGPQGTLCNLAFDIMPKRQREFGLEPIMIPTNAVVELQTLPDFKVIGKAHVDTCGRYCIRMERAVRNPCRVYCKMELCEFGRKVWFYDAADAANIVYNSRKRAYVQNLLLNRNRASISGRCIRRNGTPMKDVYIYVSLITTPAGQDDRGYPPRYETISDENGRWRIDGILTPPFDRLMTFMCNANSINLFDSTCPPLKIQVDANLPIVNGEDMVFPNITAAKRTAIEKVIAVWERKTGKKYPRSNPLVNFPESTNDVIYVDVILP